MTNPAVGVISSYFGPRDLWGYYDYHIGLDIAGSGDIVSVLKGVVIDSRYAGSYGNMVLVDHGIIDGKSVKTRYAHLYSSNVAVGTVLEKGQVLGIMGTTGNSSGVHLHFEVIINDQVVDPITYVNY